MKVNNCSVVADKNPVLAAHNEKPLRCVQCGGEPDGDERPHLIDGKTVLLHDTCARFFMKERRVLP